MKKIITLLLLLSNFFSFAQTYTSIPSIGFEQELINQGIDSGIIDGKILTSKISGLTSLTINGKPCNNLIGIEDFTSLNYLTCSSCGITNIDLSKNLALQEINLVNNSLHSLDVSKNTSLTKLTLGLNFLTNLDVSQNTALTSLDIQRNGITSLNISNNTGLQELNCSTNQLTSLDVSINTALTTLSCSQNQISNLDVSKNILLKTLSCGENKISNLDVSKNTKLTLLGCSENLLTTLNVFNNTKLTELYCNSNQLSNLDVSQNTDLINLFIYNNNLTNIDVLKNTNLIFFHLSNNQFTNLDISQNNKLKFIDCSDNKLTNLDVSAKLDLINLQAKNNQILNLDLSKNINLVNFNCNNNQLTSLNLKNGQNTKLNLLDFKSNSSLSCIQVDNATYSNGKWSTYKDATTSYSNNCNAFNSAPPVLTATGDQLYCPKTDLNIVTSFSITHDPVETGTLAAYVQISSGYSIGLDKLTLSNPTAHPSIVSSWDTTTGKLKLSSPIDGVDVLYSELEAAVKDVTFTNSSASASGLRTFSITIGQANYLPSTGHYYLYVPSIGITWTQAKAAAEASTYYGLKGYLATLLAPDEAKLSGEQASGAGWIGGSDAETEGVWKWVTGPEAGTVMSYTFWNTGEPNQSGNEDYAHITSGVGIPGSWNDLQNEGQPSGNYQPKGYIAEYGGMPGESPLQIAASTKITIPIATPGPDPDPVCDSGSFTFTATPTTGATISWYSSAIGGYPLATGNSYTTPIINATTTYYVDAGCESNRKSIVATVNTTPAVPVATQSTYTNCGSGSLTIEAISNIGSINWYTTLTGGASIYTGTNFKTPVISANTTYYAEASNKGCTNPTRTPVDIIIYTPPVVTDEEVPLCQSQKKILNAGVTGLAYLWSTGETTQTIEINKGGIYTVDVTSAAPESCTSKKTITVNEHHLPEIKNIEVKDRTVSINLNKEEDYFEYSVDGTNFQDSNHFFNVPGGLQTAYVREKNGCGEITQNFVVIIVPTFFTPNDDGFNDSWEITGMENYPEAKVTIFDRYGKFLIQLNIANRSWDGTLNKTPLPTSDYWYSLKIDNTKPEITGHFSLKR